MDPNQPSSTGRKHRFAPNSKAAAVPKIGKAKANDKDGDAKAKDNDKIYLPITIPWRRPDCGDPDNIDEAEVGEAATNSVYDENSQPPASELFANPDGTSKDGRLLFLQFPAFLPAIKRSATAKGKEIVVSSEPSDRKGPMAMDMGKKGFNPAVTPQRSCGLEELCSSRLEELPAGHMGKLLVYKSGAVKLKLGESLFDVSAGQDCSFTQKVMALNIKEKDFCSIGNLHSVRAVITPDLDSLLDLG